MQIFDNLQLNNPILNVNECDFSTIKWDGGGRDFGNDFRSLWYHSPDLVFTDISGNKFNGYISFDLRLYEALPEFDVEAELVVTPVEVTTLDEDNDPEDVVLYMDNFYYPTLKCIGMFPNIIDGDFELFNCEQENNLLKNAGLYREIISWDYK